MSNSKTGAFAFAALALELAAELSAQAEKLESIACSSKAEETYEEVNYALEALEMLIKDFTVKNEGHYEKYLR